MLKTRFVLFVLLLVATQLGHAQLEAANWYFGDNAGIRFDPDTGQVSPLTNGSLRTDEGCSTISDTDGNLLFYTDGITVYNRNHEVMQNGNDLRGNPSSTQSGIIIPKPGDPNIYYIFTVSNGSAAFNNVPALPAYGMNYYEVDMTLDSGNGAVTTDVNNPPNLISLCSEKIAAISADNDEDIFVVGYANEDGNSSIRFNTTYTFKVTTNGVETSPVENTFSRIVRDESRGYLKFSSDGTKLISANMDRGTYLYDFNDVTGEVSNERALDLNFRQGYGVEFSPNNQFLYISATNGAGAGAPASAHQTNIYQFDVEKPNITEINASRLSIYDGLGYRGALQLGVNGKIYFALSDNYPNGKPFLGVINNPDVKGAGANYQHDAIPLAGRLSRQGLPPFIQTFFASINVENICEGDDTLFSFETDTAPNSVEWDFGDGNTSTQLTPTIQYARADVYDIVLTLDFLGTKRKFFKQIEIFDTPTANPTENIFACDDNLDSFETFDLIETTAEILGGQDAQRFLVSYYRNQSDADFGENEINVPYATDIPQQRLYARVDNRFNIDCYSTISFQVNIYDQPVANTVEDLEACDDNFDGFETFDLSDQSASILATQNAADFTISYHLNSNDAALDQNPLPLSYRNTTPFRQTIFARVENNAETSCEATTSFDLVVQERPDAIDFTGFQCDEDGVPDQRTNFNLSSFDESVSNNASDVAVTYYLDQNDADNDNNPLDRNDYRNLTPVQNIVARVTNQTTGCFNTANVTLRVSASDAQDALLEQCDDDGIEDGLHTFTLTNADNAVLTNAPSDVTVNYYLTATDALAERNALSTQFTNTTPNSQVIYARAESPDGNCFGISEVELRVNELPQIVPTDYQEYCGNDPQPLTIDAGPLPGATADYTYQWSTGETTFAIDVRDGGDYTVVVSNSNNCTNERVVTVVISEPATIDRVDVVNANGGTFGSATIVVSGLGDYEFRIDPNAAYQENPVFEQLDPGFYTVFVNDKNGCGETSATFSIVGYPRFFTPNGDGFNDFWQLDGVNAMFEPDTTIYIFDRYGKLLKQLLPTSPGWDGTFNGEPLPSTDYWFKATLIDGTEFSANFSLKR
ncbi:gliding motility-associated C-terminal domain-containing protein [Nonlabens sp. Hel1_33_55]|uniref:T9SS type B sorting domain-containing protein n=1 Tax=Nonlabens sp. Hel1_33_55 TaxID=1336802 RepID=UPI000875B0FD|nr:T9SS type B sorting domain-containing protein [Nonlabens sp. Hel1_33_55]SCX96959.1 gliding motility-associated C-terminal domain-containing protein [Nonlabens sp. Hel1_33_55]